MSDYIHQDLLFPILKRMPVKTLLQWRCVCKSWKQLIDSTAFILDHLAIQRSRIIIQNQNLEYDIFDPCTLALCDTLTGPDGVTIAQVGEPLIICSVHGVVFLYDDTHYILWNPSIRHSIRIPFPGDPPEELQFCGLWIDPSTGDFKIVMLNFDQHTISLISEAWTETGIAEELCSDNRNSVLIGKVAHWIASISKEFVVVFFDFGQDRFGTIELPELPPLNIMMSDKNVCKWNGLLSLVQVYAGYCDFWVMQNGCWSKMFKFRLTNDIGQVFHVWEDCRRVLAVNDEGILLLYVPGVGRELGGSLWESISKRVVSILLSTLWNALFFHIQNAFLGLYRKPMLICDPEDGCISLGSKLHFLALWKVIAVYVLS